MLLGRGTAVVSVEHVHIGRVRTENGDLLHVLGKRKHAFVLEKHH